MLIRNQGVQSEKVHLSTRSQKLSHTLILLPTVMYLKLAVEQHLSLVHLVFFPLTLQRLFQAINLATKTHRLSLMLPVLTVNLASHPCTLNLMFSLLILQHHFQAVKSAN